MVVLLPVPVHGGAREGREARARQRDRVRGRERSRLGRRKSRGERGNVPAAA